MHSTLGIGPHPFSRMIYEDRLRPRPAEDDPREIPRNCSRTSCQPRAQARARPPASRWPSRSHRRKSVLDFVMADYTRLSARLGGFDKRKLDGHLSGLRQLEGQLAAAVAGPTPSAKQCQRGADPSAAFTMLETDARLAVMKRWTPSSDPLTAKISTVSPRAWLQSPHTAG